MSKKILAKNFLKRIPPIVKLLPIELLILIVSCAILIVGAFIFIKTHENFAANFADNTLRPTIGNANAITIESLFFRMEDDFNHMYYIFKKPQSANFTFTKVKKTNSASTAASLNTFFLSPITSLHYFLPLAGEDTWSPINNDIASTIMAKTFVRPDPLRDYATVALVKMDLTKISLGAVAGTWEPGEQAAKGLGKVPQQIQQSNTLLAAFNGGFQKKDGNYGMIVGETIYLPLLKNLATLVLYKNAPAKLIKYTGQNLGKNVIAIRQNGPLILQNGTVLPSPNENSTLLWGRTTTNSMYTWRSGIGITADNNLIYAVGPSLVPETLAKALQAAGAVTAMQLDINPVWVRFILFHSLGNGQYTYTPLLQDMVNGGSAYLYSYQKDFFYVYKSS